MTQPLGNCPGCGGDEPFEQVHGGPGGPCPDVDGECPEWVCLGCGTAVFLGIVVFSGMPAGTADQAAAPAGRSARAA